MGGGGFFPGGGVWSSFICPRRSEKLTPWCKFKRNGRSGNNATYGKWGKSELRVVRFRVIMGGGRR